MKKLISLLISLSVILTCMSGISLVASADVPIGSVTLAGTGTDADPYIIDSADKFVAVFGNGSTADLTKVYLLTGFDQTAMELPTTYQPNTTTAFNGKLLGGNIADGIITPVKQRINLTANYTAKSNLNGTYGGGIFNKIDSATLSDLIISGTFSVTAIDWNIYIGGLTGYAKSSSIIRCENYVNITGTGNYVYGGICGKIEGDNSSIENCTNNGSMTVTGDTNRANYVGGIIGEAFKGTITNCINNGTVSGNLNVGGIVAWANANPSITNCINNGTVSSTRTDTTDTFVGGIIGLSTLNKPAKIESCQNYGTITGNKYLAGILGYQKQNTNKNNELSLINCENYGSMTSSGGRCSGIIGKMDTAGTISKCANFADIYSNSNNVQIAGILGITGNTSITINIEKCYNKGNMISGSAFGKGFSSGLVGWIQAQDTVNVSNCYNIGELIGYHKGAVAGQKTAGGTLNITNFFDLVNTGVAFINYGETTPNSVADAYTNANLTEIQGLIDDTVWVAQEGYNYPSLKDNLYKSNLVGAGTSESPYRIYSTGDLKLVSTKPAAFYKQMLDITGMDTILCKDTAFSGTYDGNNKKIDLAIDESKVTTGVGRLVGLFEECASPAVLKNIITTGYVKTGWINYQGGAGVLTGKATGTTVQNCKNYASLDVHGYRAGGFIGLTSGATTITNCYNYGNIYATDEASGLVANLSDNATIKNCGNYGNVSSILTASGIGHYNYSTKTIENVFNIGTITATDKEKGVACGLFAAVQNRGGLIKNCFNAGALCAKTSFGIAHSNATTASNRTNNWNVTNCYNASYATYPVAGNLGTITLNITNCYYLADTDTDGLDNTTDVTPDSLKAAETLTALGDAYSIVNDYKYPQLTANLLDTEKDNIDFYLVTVTDNTENETEVALNTGKVGSFYLPTGANLKVTVTPAPYFYYATIDGEKETEKEYQISGNTTVVVADGISEVADVENETISTVDAFEGNDAITVGEETYNEYSLVYAKVNWNPLGLKLVGFGILQGTDENMTKDSYENNFAGTNGKISSDGAFGILIHNAVSGEGLQEGTTYYFIPYGRYVDVEGNPYTIYGNVNPFTYNVVE